MSEATYWNGEPATCARGWGRIAHDMPEVGKWQGAAKGDKLRVVRVFYGGESFDLLDQDDRAWNKVTTGRGGPRFGHRNVRLQPSSFEPDDWGVLGDEYFRRAGIEGQEQQ